MKQNAASPVLAIRNLSVEFHTTRGRLRALRRVNLDVPRGGIMGLVGESGCGKSTIIAAALGLLASNGRVTSGEIRFDGEDIVTMNPERLRSLRGDRLSVVFQDPMTALNPVLSIGSQMTAIQYRTGRTRSEKQARAVEMMRRVKIPDAAARLSQYPHQFSGGMRQRICIAMALLAEPDLLIADEPTTALDATLEVQVINLLKGLQAEFGCSVLFISHHLGVVAELCDQVAVMYAGEVVERGSVRDIFHHAAHPYAMKLIECDPGRIGSTTRTLPTIPGELPDLAALPEGCIFRSRCDRAVARCASEAPAEREIDKQHLAACHVARGAG